jgi:hypothetical protein
MLPGVEEPVRRAIYQSWEQARREVAQWTQRAGQIDARLKEKIGDEDRQRLQKERAELAAKLAGADGALDHRLTELGVTADGIARLKRMPRGALREERYNHGVLLEAPGLADAQRVALVRIVAVADGAQAALEEQRVLLERSFPDASERLVKDRVTGVCRQQIHAIERRFWRMAYYVLTPDQMRAARDLFSPRYRALPELEQQMYLLPDLEPAQGNRLRALFREVESETAADPAVVQRLQALLRAGSVPNEERQETQRQIGEAYARLTEIRETMRPRIEAILDAAQWDALRALPPVINIGERARGPWEIAREVRLEPEQRTAIEAAVKELQQRAAAIERERREASKDAAATEVGSESPQAMTMQMTATEARGRTIDAYRDLGQHIFVDILAPAQAAAWVAAPDAKP